jgi:hypothetical protein
MVFTTSAAAYASKTFREQVIITMIINFGVNFGWEWWAMSAWPLRHAPCTPSCPSLPAHSSCTPAPRTPPQAARTGLA